MTRAFPDVIRFTKYYQDNRAVVRRPTVRFRNLNSTLHRYQHSDNNVNPESSRVDAESTSTDSISDDNGDESVEDTEDESNTQLDVDENTEEPLGRESQRRRPYDKERGDRILVADVANLNSYILHDLLSDTPLSVPKPQFPTVSPNSSQPRTLRASDWC